MILESLKVMLFGMLGIFFVMGVIIISIRLLGVFQKDKDGDGDEGEPEAQAQENSD